MTESLIDPEATFKVSPYGWSISRHRTFDECRRKYLLHYFAAFEDERLGRLKNLKTVYIWVGELVHDAVESWFKTHDTLPTEEELAALIRGITHGQMPQDWRFSEAGMKKFRLWEHHYGKPVDRDEKLALIGQVAMCLKNIFRSALARDIVDSGRKSWLSVEDKLELPLSDYYAHVKMDFCYRSKADGRVKVVDWKTGKGLGRQVREQMMTYGMYAVHKGWAASLAEVDLIAFYAFMPKAVIYQPEEAEASKAKAFIHGSMAAMRSLENDNRTVAAVNFNPANSKWSCQGCNFREVCWPNWEEAEQLFGLRHS